MARTKKGTELAIVNDAPLQTVPPKRELILQGDPEEQIKFAQKAATALMKVAKPIDVAGKKYLQYGGWQTLARFFGATVGVEWTQKLVDDKGKLVGYEARAIVYQAGEIISSAEASCMCNEKRWATAEEFAVKSMAQTRASAKALRNAFGWVAELAQDPESGQKLQSTPYEEMAYDKSPVSNRAKVKVYTQPTDEAVDPSLLVCLYPECEKKITNAEYNWSVQRYGQALCRDHQKPENKVK